MVELLASIAIIAIIVGIMIPIAGGFIETGKVTSDRQTLAVLNDALNRYKMQGGDLSVLTSGASVGNILKKLAEPITWAGVTHQFLKGGSTYNVDGIETEGEGSQYSFTSYASPGSPGSDGPPVPSSIVISASTLSPAYNESVSFTSTGTTGTTWQWQGSDDNSSWEDISGETSTTYSYTQRAINGYAYIRLMEDDTLASNVLAITLPDIDSVNGPYTIGVWNDITDIPEWEVINSDSSHLLLTLSDLSVYKNCGDISIRVIYSSMNVSGTTERFNYPLRLASDTGNMQYRFDRNMSRFGPIYYSPGGDWGSMGEGFSAPPSGTYLFDACAMYRGASHSATATLHNEAALYIRVMNQAGLSSVELRINQ